MTYRLMAPWRGRNAMLSMHATMSGAAKAIKRECPRIDGYCQLKILNERGQDVTKAVVRRSRRKRK